jgi:Rac GTPase-activating protein 1
MHFQRISECPEVKMPLTNFAKIFGPTIVGYSCAEPDQHMMFAETQIQFSVMFALLNIPTDYWNRFITLKVPTKSEEQREIETYGSKFYSGTPSMKIVRKERKFYDTPPYINKNKKK